MSAAVAELLALNLESDFGKPLHEQLSDREYQVMCLIAVGKSLKDIADDLRVSISTVNTYRARILEKMQLKNNTELTHYAIENRLVNRLVRLTSFSLSYPSSMSCARRALRSINVDSHKCQTATYKLLKGRCYSRSYPGTHRPVAAVIS